MRQRTVVVVLFLRTFSCVYTRNSPLGCITCKCVWTHAAFNLKRVPGELSTVCLIKLNFREFNDFKAFSYLRLYNLPDRMGVPVGSSICIKL